MNQFADSDRSVTEKFKCKTKILYILPVEWEISFADLFTSDVDKHIKYDYGAGMGKFAQKMSAVGLGGSYLKVYVSPETFGEDTVSNEFTTNVIEEKIRAITNPAAFPALKNIRDTIRSRGSSTGIGSPSPANPIVNAFLQHSQISLPKIWDSQNYQGGVNYTTSLVSIYGSKRGIKKHIVEPIAAMYCIASASSTDGATIQNSTYVSAASPGNSAVQLGVVTNISKAADGNSPINIWKQSLAVNLSFNIDSASSGFATLINGEPVTVGDAMSPAAFSDTSAIMNTVGTSIINSLRPCRDEDKCNLSPPSANLNYPGSGGRGSSGGASLQNDNHPIDRGSGGMNLLNNIVEFTQDIAESIDVANIRQDMKDAADSFATDILDKIRKL
jgi:hypothetical protein